MKIKILILLTFGFSSHAFACLAASQERIIPIGTSEGCLVGIEIISRRDSEGRYSEKAIWYFDFKLKGFNEDYSDFLIQELDTKQKVNNNEVEEYLKTKAREALSICQKMETFEILKANEISFCEYQKNCSKVSLIKAKDELRFRINKTQKDYPIKYLSKDYDGAIAKPYREYVSFYLEDSEDYESALGQYLSISSIRTYENSSMELLVFHLGMGQEFEPLDSTMTNKKKETQYHKQLKNLEDAIFVEPILHHGKGFDYFQISKK